VGTGSYDYVLTEGFGFDSYMIGEPACLVVKPQNTEVIAQLESRRLYRAAVPSFPRARPIRGCRDPRGQNDRWFRSRGPT